MTDWKATVAALVHEVEERLDSAGRSVSRIAARAGVERDPIMAVVFRGFGTSERIHVKGRVLEDEGFAPISEATTRWQNLLAALKRFESDEVPGARVRLSYAGRTTEVVTDDEGYFEAWLSPAAVLTEAPRWRRVTADVVEPEGRTGIGFAMVPPDSAGFGVISDLDDTVIRTDATSIVRMARSTLFGNARTRLPFPGVAAFYSALQGGPTGISGNPIFYVSSSPWNLHDFLVEFLEVQRIPVGPLLLRDWGSSRTSLLPLGHREHKRAAIARVLETFPALPFILIGDSGQKDPEIYREVMRDFPGRILAAYIRNVTPDPERSTALQALAAEVVADGGSLVIADDTLAAARHAAERGWIDPESVEAVAALKRADEPDDGGPAAPTVHVEG
jgi:phosphatidate phosphatase APP1